MRSVIVEPGHAVERTYLELGQAGQATGHHPLFIDVANPGQSIHKHPKEPPYLEYWKECISISADECAGYKKSRVALTISP